MDLSVERIHESPSLSGPAPKGLRFAPDSSRVTYLKGKEKNKLELDLWEFHLKTKKHQRLVDSREILGAQEEVLSEEEKSLRERKRIRNSGIVSYQWNEQGSAILFPLSGDLFLYELRGKKVTQITKTKESETDGKFSPKGRYVSYIREQNLYVYDLKAKKEKQISFDGKGSIKNGMAEFVAQEEMSRFTGYWWSKEESHIAFTRVDESPVEMDTRTEIFADTTIVKKQRYPYTGTPNVRVQLLVAPLERPKKTVAIPLSKKEDIYLARVTWHPKKLKVYYQVQARDQKRLELLSFDVKSQKVTQVLEETSEAWVNILGEPKFLQKSDHFVWASERSGYRHLYLYESPGKLVKPITQGKWVVTKLARVDEKTDTVYYVSTEKTPIERHLYKVGLFKDQPRKQLSEGDGTYSVVFSKDASYYIESFSSTTIPKNVQLKDAVGEHVTWLEENRVDELHPLFSIKDQLSKCEFDSFVNDEGVKLYYSLLKPKSFDPKKKYPLIIYVYGGPHAQRVTNLWKGSLGFLHQLLAARGYIVLTVDNRGSNYRGTAFEFPIHLKLAHVETKDQISGLNHVMEKGFVDKARVGVTGHSYGGYMTLMLMGQYPDVFKAGVSVAPVTDWSLYDTHYTERYMSTPQKNPEGYKASNVLTYAKDIQGELLVVHGMADDNVLFKNTTMLFNELQKNKVTFDSMTYPGAKHGLYGKETQIHYYKTLLRHFRLHL